MGTMPEFPRIPDKRYFTVGEVGYLCQVKPHVVRLWIQEFPQLNPVTRRGNRPCFQHEDILLVRRIRQLIIVDGLSVPAVRYQLDEVQAADAANPTNTASEVVANSPPEWLPVAKSLLLDLQELHNSLSSPLNKDRV